MTKSQQAYDFQNQKINPLLFPIRIACGKYSSHFEQEN